MKATKALTTAGVGAAIVVGSMLAVNAASAHFEGGNSDERAAELAERFDLDESEVNQYFQERHQEREAEREENRAEHLASLVSDGTLTQEQADALSAKKNEMHEAREALRDQDLTRDEIREQMEASRGEFQAWAEEQGIDLDSIRGEKGEGFGHKGGHHRE